MIISQNNQIKKKTKNKFLKNSSLSHNKTLFYKEISEILLNNFEGLQKNGHCGIKFENEYRCHIVNFILRSVQALGFSKQTFFVAIGIMDDYFKAKANIIQEEGNINIILSTCIFIASKYEEKRMSFDFLPTLIKCLSRNKFKK